MIKTGIEDKVSDDNCIDIEKGEFMEAILNNARHYLDLYHKSMDIIDDIKTLEYVGYNIRYLFDEDSKEYVYEKYKPGKIGFKDE